MRSILVALVFAPALAMAAPLDLAPQGLPLRVDVPTCAQVSLPPIRIADNAHDVLVQCVKESDPAFALQIGPSAGKVGAADIQGGMVFKRWVKKAPGLLVWDETMFTQVVHHFMLTTKIGGKSYVCFTQMGAEDDERLDAMLAACKTMRAR